ncbi:hypothetical protein PTTG_00517 [Puccinia triticina 1-1 BBBD Race 1]|uniref:Rhomboid domain-containing protein n=2 Tax=Puccinia triticina TaxID=208348 RepID=A0A180H3V8_PUCT1|nr:uncharacterized protein PtA15_2A507 [Puccinia triticina]OAV99696.1 hypothetical protein PTTG_00517 [Puccinia triticina 1-1 BBBD Race 1]WAQ82190.1 hypothetical protein PtA15_2A507 [Puccinia triticina]
MRPSCFHSSYRFLGHHSPTKSLVSLQSQIRSLKEANHVVFGVRPSSFENLGNNRKLCSTSRMLAQLGRIDVKKMPVIDHDPNFALNENILQETRDFDTASNRKPGIWKPFVFFIGVSFLGFGLAIDQTNRDTAQKIDYIRTHQGTFPGWFSKTFTSFTSHPDPSDSQLQQIRKLDKWNFIKEYGLNKIFPHHILTWYINLNEGKQICCILALINLPIFALWQMPRLVKSMTQKFTHFPLSGKSYTLITSTFSHSSALHFGFNMMALYSIGSTAHDFLTHRLRASREIDPVQIPESTPTYHFLAFYLFAGLAASFGSHAYSLLIRAPRLLKWRQGLANSSTPPTPILPSLGASGAIYGCLTMTALAFPEAHVSLIFLPWVPLKIGNAVFGAMLFDFIGVIRNWRYFDHMAHLCGGFAGIFWYFFVDKWFDLLRLKVWDRYLAKEKIE